MPKKCLRHSLASTNCLAMVGKIQSIRQILVNIEEHYTVEALLGHGRSQIGFDASDSRKGPFPSCSDNRDC